MVGPIKQLLNMARGAVLPVTLALAAAWAPLAVLAQNYPDRPLKIVVGFAPGGTNDILARLIAAKLQEQLKQGVTVDNKPGANSAVGTDFVAKAKADGYTLLVSSSGGLTVNPVLMKNLPYDPLKDFEPIALLGSYPLIVTVPATLPVKSLAELIRYGKTVKDGTLNHGVASSSFQLAAETLSTASGLRFTQVNYRGSGPVVAALLAGEVQLGVLDSAAVIQQVKAGKLKALAVTTAKRSAAFPDIATVAESGLAGYEVTIWTALMAPKGTPEPVLSRLRGMVGDILKDKETVEKMTALGLDVGDADAPALSRRIASDMARWAQVAKAANIQPE
ncbi:MAG TPA: tripartite tricarboxylate transporter substrate binding protein [Burkholderiaceae bacterium]|nr:tripartite tricarboxylate transporter substrate binding protein [Burkholderiaceae bacterium]